MRWHVGVSVKWLSFAPAVLLAACSVKDPLFCDSTHPCLDPARSYCDLTGAYEPQHIRNTCVASPFDAAGVDAAAEDAAIVDGAPADGAVVDGGPDAPVPDAMPCRRKIAFVTTRTGNQEIYTMNEDGSGPVDVTNSAAHDNAPQWSPDGKWLAFLSDRSGTYQLYVAGPTGANPTKVSGCTGDAEEFGWGPGSDVLVVSCAVSTAEDDIYLVNRSGGSLNLTSQVGAHNRDPRISSSNQIAFSSDRDGDDEIFTMDEVGGNVKQLTANAKTDTLPVWSPDGSKIGFISDRAATATELYTMNADGTAQALIRAQLVRGIAWSPDGSHIALAELDSGTTWNAYALDTNGANPVNLSSMPTGYVAQGPAWSPDSGQVAFEADGPMITAFHVFKANANGSGFTDLTKPDDGSLPSWQPVCH